MKQTTQALLAQLLQRLKSNIPVRTHHDKTREWIITELVASTFEKCRIDSLDKGLATDLWNVLNDCLQLPECLKVIGYLRRLAVFNEHEIRLQVQLSFSLFQHYIYPSL